MSELTGVSAAGPAHVPRAPHSPRAPHAAHPPSVAGPRLTYSPRAPHAADPSLVAGPGLTHSSRARHAADPSPVAGPGLTYSLDFSRSPGAGQGLVEYGLILGLSAVLAVLILVLFGDQVADVVQWIGRTVDAATGAG